MIVGWVWAFHHEGLDVVERVIIEETSHEMPVVDNLKALSTTVTIHW